MKCVTLILLALLFSGCHEMSRKETISACKECTDAGFDAVIIINGWDLNVADVKCEGRVAAKPQVR